MGTVRPGVYKHHSGKMYRVRCVAKHTETGEMLVVYHPLYGGRDSYLCCPVSKWSDHVEIDGYFSPRFVYVRER